MDRSTQLEFLKRKYIDLSRQYLQQLHKGKPKEDLRDFAEVIIDLIREMELIEKDILDNP